MGELLFNLADYESGGLHLQLIVNSRILLVNSCLLLVYKLWLQIQKSMRTMATEEALQIGHQDEINKEQFTLPSPVLATISIA